MCHGCCCLMREWQWFQTLGVPQTPSGLTKLMGDITAKEVMDTWHVDKWNDVAAIRSCGLSYPRSGVMIAAVVCLAFSNSSGGIKIINGARHEE